MIQKLSLTTPYWYFCKHLYASYSQSDSASCKAMTTFKNTTSPTILLILWFCVAIIWPLIYLVYFRVFCYTVFSSQGLKGNSEAVSFHRILACIFACPCRLPVTNKMWSLQSVKGWKNIVLGLLTVHQFNKITYTSWKHIKKQAWHIMRGGPAKCFHVVGILSSAIMFVSFYSFRVLLLLL